jgi:CubicO group peptidase (beta-lactamase class C family)
MSPVSLYASPTSFGHSGFTGTLVWADPESELVYVFLSNRVHPHQYNKTLIQENFRTRIQDVIYRAIINPEKR